MSRFSTRLRYRLLVVLGIVGLGLVLRWPVLGAPMTADDWDHYAMQQGIYPVRLHPLDMFNFVPGNAAARRALLGSGFLPWFAAPNIRLSVFRPLASALTYVDYAWFAAPHHVYRLHLHSLVWWVCMLAGAAAVLTRLLPFPAAAIALLIYTVDDVHTWPLVWAANRSQIIAIAFIFWALWANMLASAGERRMRVLAVALGALGILAGEHALAPLGYLVAFELFGTSGGLRERVLRVWPWALLAVGFVALHVALGYGAAGSSIYVSPSAEPLRYLAVSWQRLPKQLAELGFGIPVEWWSVWPAWDLVLFVQSLASHWVRFPQAFQLQWGLGVLAGAVAVVVSVWFGSRAVRSTEPYRALHWLLIGALLSLTPLAATEAMTRLNVAPALGFAAVFGWSMWRAMQLLASKSRLAGRCGAALALSALLYLCLAYPAKRSYLEGKFMSAGMTPQEAARRLGDFGVSTLTARHVFIVDSPEVPVQSSLMYMLHFDHRPLPASIELLTPAISNAHLLQRVASNVLDIRFPDALVGQPFTHAIYRSEDFPFHAGQVLHCARFDVSVMAVSHGEPTHLRFVFPTALEDARYLWMVPRRDGPGVTPFTPPPIGASLRLPAALPVY